MLAEGSVHIMVMLYRHAPRQSQHACERNEPRVCHMPATRLSFNVYIHCEQQATSCFKIYVPFLSLELFNLAVQVFLERSGMILGSVAYMQCMPDLRS